MSRLIVSMLFFLAWISSANAVFFQGALNNILCSTPTNSVAPAVSPTSGASGQLFTSTSGTWSGSPSFSYQWYQADLATPISGATSNTYTAVSGDVGHTLQSKVIASSGGCSSPAVASNTTSAITSGGGFSFPGAPLAIFSTRKVVAAYAGNAVTVRRASDNSTQNIGFSGTDFNSSALTTFCAGTNCYVTTWFDQSGNGSNASQATTTSQPAIMIGASGKAYLTFATTHFLTTSSPVAANSDQTLGVVNWSGSGNVAQIPLSDFDASGHGWFLRLNQIANQGGYFSDVTATYVQGGDMRNTSPSRLVATRTSGAVNILLNGVSVSSATGQSNTTPTGPLAIGGYNINALFDGAISEAFVYSSALSSANLASIDANESTYWGNWGYSTPYAGAFAVQLDPGGFANAGSVLAYEYTQPWTAFAAVQLYGIAAGTFGEVIFSDVPASGTAFPGYELWVDGTGRLRVRLINNVSTNIFLDVQGSTILFDGNKHFVAASYDGSGLAAGVKLYVDGVAETMTTLGNALAGNSIVTAGQSLFIGSQNNTQDGLAGQFGHFQIDNVVRSAAYIAAHSTSSSLPTIDGNTAISLALTEGAGTTPHDASSNNFAVTLSNSTWVPGTSVPFTPLHTYFMASAGHDSCNGLGTSTSTTNPCAWASPNHPVVCGDVIIAAAGTYTNGILTSTQPSSCPSPTGTTVAFGGIAGSGGNSYGGINFAVVLCGGADLEACQVNCTGGSCPGQSGHNTGVMANEVCCWAFEGFKVQGSGDSTDDSFEGHWCGTNNHLIAWINDISWNSGSAFGVNSCQGAGSGGGADYFAVVGDISQNSAQSAVCLAAIDFVGVQPWDTAAGTHAYMFNNYAIKNDGSTGCTQPPGPRDVDVEGMMCDTCGTRNYSNQVVFANNIIYQSHRMGLHIIAEYDNSLTPNIAGIPTIKMYKNTLYANNDGSSWTGQPSGTGIIGDLQLDGSLVNWHLTVQNNIAQTHYLETPGGGGDVYALYIGTAYTSLTVGGSGNENIFKGMRSDCTHGGFCDAGNNVNSGFSGLLGTNTYTDPLFGVSPQFQTGGAHLLANFTGAPNCTGKINVTQCMGWDASTSTLTAPSVISDLAATAVGSAPYYSMVAGKGFQLPSTTCAANADYPTWLKGIVYLHWNGSSITENSDLVTKPCGL